MQRTRWYEYIMKNWVIEIGGRDQIFNRSSEKNFYISFLSQMVPVISFFFVRPKYPTVWLGYSFWGDKEIGRIPPTLYSNFGGPVQTMETILKEGVAWKSDTLPRLFYILRDFFVCK